MLKTQSMNLDFIRTFVIVGQSRDLADAASKLSIDVTNVSRHIKALEDIMGTKLLNRSSKNFELTEDGKKLFEGYEKAYNMMLLTEKTFMQGKTLNSGKLTIGVSSAIEMDLVNDKIKSFKQKYPNVVIKVVNLSTKELFDKLSQFYMDFVIDTPLDNLKKSSNIKVNDLLLDEYCIAYSPKYSNVVLNSINDLSSLPLILPITSKEERNRFEELISIDGFEKNLSIEVDNYISGKDYAESGFGFALLPKRYVNGTDLKSFDIDLSKKIAISYIEENLSPSAKQFLSEFK